MKYVRGVTFIFFAVVFITFSFSSASGQEFGEPASRPLRVDRFVHSDSGKHVFMLNGGLDGVGRPATAAAFSDSLKAEPEEPASFDSRVFYVYPEHFTGTIPISVFETPEGGVAFARNDTERQALVANGASDTGHDVYVYAARVEGASEVFRLRRDSDTMYTTSRREREQLLSQGWQAAPSLGWAQSDSSSGTGILLPTTVKLDEAALSQVTAASLDGATLVFPASDSFASSLRPDQVLYAERSNILPFGLVARVADVRHTGFDIQVLTTPAELTDAFSEVHLFVDGKPFYFLPMKGRDRGNLKLRPANLATSIGWTPWSTGADASVTTSGSATWNTTSGSASGSITVDASLQLGVTAEIVYNAYNACVVNPTATFLITPRETATINITATGQLSPSAEKKIAGPFAGTFMLGGIPITGQVDVFAGYAANGTLTASVSATETARATIGAQYNLTTRTLSKIACPSPCPSGFRCGPTLPAPSQTCSVSVAASTATSFSASATAYVKPQLYVYAGAWGTGLGPYGWAKAQVQARLEMPNMNLYAQLLAGGSAKVTLAYCTLAQLPEFETSPLEKRFASIPIPLAAPSTVLATKGTYRDRVTVTWSSVTYASGYYVYRAVSATGTKTRLTSSPITTLKFDDTSATAGTTYFYWVTTLNGSKEGPFGTYATGNRAK